MEVAVLGGGHGCYAAAADIAEAGHSVRFWRRNTLAFAPVLDTQSITLTDTRGRRTIPLTLATKNIAEAIDGAQLILSPIPGFAQEELARMMAPSLREGQVIFLPPGTFGSYVMAQEILQHGNTTSGLAFADAGTLPWLVRKQSDGAIRITTRAERLPTGIFPNRLADHGFSVINQLFPAVEQRADALDAALLNYGPIIHPPLILMNAGPLSHFDSWDIHNEGTQEVVRNVQDALDTERIAIREALGYSEPHFPLSDHYKRDPKGNTMYPVTSHDELVESSDWREKIDLHSHRYMLEDIALGLMFIVSVGEWLGVPCPVASGLVETGGAAIGQDFRKTGRTLDNLGLGGITRDDFHILLNKGIG